MEIDLGRTTAITPTSTERHRQRSAHESSSDIIRYSRTRAAWNRASELALSDVIRRNEHGTECQAAGGDAKVATRDSMDTSATVDAVYVADVNQGSHVSFSRLLDQRAAVGQLPALHPTFASGTLLRGPGQSFWIYVPNVWACDDRTFGSRGSRSSVLRHQRAAMEGTVLGISVIDTTGT